MSKYEVEIGDDFSVVGVEIDDVEEVDRLAKIADRRRLSKRQDRMIMIALLAELGALLVSSLFGFFDGSYNELTATWGFVGPALVATLFPALQKNGILPNYGKDSNEAL